MPRFGAAMILAAGAGAGLAAGIGALHPALVATLLTVVGIGLLLIRGR